jgi:hypothetical protein
MSQQFAKDVVMDGVRGRGENIVLAILIGTLAAILGALLWMGVEMLTHMRLGVVAIAIGFLVGMAVRVAGNGTGMLFGIIGTVLTFIGCLGGELLSRIASSTSDGRTFLDILSTVDFIPTITAIFSQMGPMTYLIYGIGIYEGYKLSIRT